MKKIILLIISVLLLNVAGGQNADRVFEQNFPSIVTLKCVDVLGYGFFVEKNLIATTYEVISKARIGAAKAVVNATGSSYDVVGYVAANKDENLVLLKVNSNEGIPLKLRETKINEGADLYLFSKKSDTNLYVAKSSFIELKDFGDFRLLKMKSPASLANSGFPVLDENGYVAGISIPTQGRDTNLCYAIPVRKIQEMLENKKDSAQNLRELIPAEIIVREKSQQKSPNVVQYLKQGNERMALKDYKGAAEKFGSAINISPMDADAYVFRGQARYLLMEYKDALTDFNKAIEIQPDYSEAFDLRGIVKAELGDKDGACEDWLKSFTLGFDKAFQLMKQFCDLEKLK